MATDETGKQQDKAKSAPPADSGDTQTFAPEDLIARSIEYLDVPSYEAAGGLFGEKKPLSLAEARSKIEAWLEKPVQEV
jgi:hypothetical protein